MSENNVFKKRFYDLEKEEQWLNEMSEKGLAMKEIKCGIFKDTYYFEPCDKKYIFRIDYNSELPVLEEITSPYVMFVTSTYEAEFLVCRREKVYFRKAEEKGDFPPIYTTAESRLSVEKRKFRQFIILALLFVFDIVMYCTPLGAALNLAVNSPSVWLKLIAFTVATVFLVYCIVMAYRHYKKIAEIKKNMKD